MSKVTKEELKALWRVQRVIYKQCQCDPSGPCMFCTDFPDLKQNHGLILDLYGKLHDEIGDPF